MEWLFSWGVVSVVAVSLASFGQGFVGSKDFKLARTFFLMAAAYAMGGIAMWGAKSTWPTWASNLTVIGMCGAIGFLALELIRYVDRKREQEYKSIASVTISPGNKVQTPDKSRSFGKVPASLTLTPPAGKIKLIFKSSPLFNQKTKQRITTDLTRFRDYLIKLDIPVPVSVPPIGTQDDTGTGSYTPPGLANYRGRLVLGGKSAGSRLETTGLYCGYVMDTLLFGPDSPLQPAFGNLPITNAIALNLATAQMMGEQLCTYLNFSFWNKPQENKPLVLRSFLSGALCDIREKFGREFTDQMVGYTLRSMIDNPIKGINDDLKEYFMKGLKTGESVVDNDGSRWPEIEATVRKHGFF